jgi:hypothetical protein
MRSALYGRLLAAAVFPVLLVTLAAAPAAVASPPAQPAIAAGHHEPVLVAFRSRFRFGGARGRSYGFGGIGRSRPRNSVIHRLVKTAIWLYVLHLFFAHGGLSVLLWIVIIGLVVSLLRRRRRRYAY